MKKTVKAAGKRGSRAKSTQNARKSTVNTAKRSTKRRKSKKTDTLKAFLLVGVLVSLSLCVSLAVILVRQTLNNSRVASMDLPSVAIEADPTQTNFPEQNAPLSPANTALPVSDAMLPPRDAVLPASDAARPPVPVSQPPQSQPASTTPSSSAQPTRNVPSSAPPERNVKSLGNLVFFIDDAGNNLRELEPFLSLPGPLTIAVLPGLPHSAEAARRIRASGKEVFLHQPMEAIGAQNPGPGAIYSGMSAEEIRSILRRNIAEVGPVVGINNHQGSRITMDRDAMETILSFCAENNLLFLDSRTTADTVAPFIASRLGIKIGERDVFIDNEQDRESMLSYITGGLSRAQRNGKAVMIGHTWSPALAPLLNEQFVLLTRQGYTLKTASDIIK